MNIKLAPQRNESFLPFPISGKRRPHGRRKVSVGKEGAPHLCQMLEDTIWSSGKGASNYFSFAKLDSLNSVDAFFQQAAEKVDNKITMNKKIYGGAPCVANTRVPVYAILEMVEAGYSHRRILKAFPTIDKGGLEAALRFTVLVMER